jgi:hypothetical protein
MKQQLEYFPYKCPHCSNVRNAADVAAELPAEVLRLAGARLNARNRRTLAPGPGRPTTARCPGCSQEMSYADLRAHRIPCVRQELERVRGMAIQLLPKDPDPYPNFYIGSVTETEVEFRKGSNGDCVALHLRKVAEITVSPADKLAYIRVLGRIVWREDIKRWRFAPTAEVGRPRRIDSSVPSTVSGVAHE